MKINKLRKHHTSDASQSTIDVRIELKNFNPKSEFDFRIRTKPEKSKKYLRLIALIALIIIVLFAMLANKHVSIGKVIDIN